MLRFGGPDDAACLQLLDFLRIQAGFSENLAGVLADARRLPPKSRPLARITELDRERGNAHERPAAHCRNRRLNETAKSVEMRVVGKLIRPADARVRNVRRLAP